MSILLALLLACQEPTPPLPSDDRFTIELVAREPEIANPTGLAVDGRGRIWVVENNTHMRPKDYPGPATDRLRVFEDFGPDGRARKATTVVDDFVLGMNVAIGLKGEVYLVTRNGIDLVTESRRPLVRLETVGDYHHNGLFGLAVDSQGNLTFAIGRNTGKDFPVGAPWTLVGSDGCKISGTEGGRIFRCRADGSALAPVASGFWNTFHMTFDGAGRLFAIDNDPGGGSECRLLHIIQGGDYGFRPRAGYRDGHPFHSWTGEHPGTLPMVSFTGEAPAGILCCTSDRWPAEYQDTLLVTSWGDHQVERYRLEPKGASFTARRDIILRGGETFRPVGIASAPDGSIVLSDWVDRSYPVHGKGRVWRIRPKTAAPVARTTPVRSSAEERLQSLLTSPPPPDALVALLEDPDPFVVGAAVAALGRPGASEELARRSTSDRPKIRLGILAALQRTGDKVNPAVIKRYLADPEPSVRRAAIQWAAEDGLVTLSIDIAAAAARAPVTLEVFEAYLGALEFLVPPTEGRRDARLAEKHLALILSDPHGSDALRAYALRMLRPDHPLLSTPNLQDWADRGDDALRLEAVRTLATSLLEPAQETLRRIAADRERPLAQRLEATAGLGLSVTSSPATRQVLLALTGDAHEELQLEAVRSAGGAAADPDVRRALHGLLDKGGDRGDLSAKVSLVLKLGGEAIAAPQPATNGDWKAAAREGGNADAGERLFFSPRGPQCFVCHRVRGRGGEVGPDLSRVSRGFVRERLIDSILEPSAEIAPDFAAWELVTREGDTWVGRILKEETRTLVLLGPSGRPVSLPREEIVGRRPSRVSMMPDGLQRGLTASEFRDLVAFLASLR